MDSYLPLMAYKNLVLDIPHILLLNISALLQSMLLGNSLCRLYWGKDRIFQEYKCQASYSPWDLDPFGIPLSQEDKMWDRHLDNLWDPNQRAHILEELDILQDTILEAGNSVHYLGRDNDCNSLLQDLFLECKGVIEDNRPWDQFLLGMT